MQRRRFMTRSAVAGATAASIAAPALAQGSRPEVRWRLASSYPKNLDTLVGAVDLLARRLAELTDNKFQIRVHHAGEIAPPLQVLDTVQQGNVECGQMPG